MSAWARPSHFIDDDFETESEEELETRCVTDEQMEDIKKICCDSFDTSGGSIDYVTEKVASSKSITDILSYALVYDKFKVINYITDNIPIAELVQNELDNNCQNSWTVSQAIQIAIVRGNAGALDSIEELIKAELKYSHEKDIKLKGEHSSVRGRYSRHYVEGLERIIKDDVFEHHISTGMVLSIMTFLIKDLKYWERYIKKLIKLIASIRKFPIYPDSIQYFFELAKDNGYFKDADNLGDILGSVQEYLKYTPYTIPIRFKWETDDTTYHIRDHINPDDVTLEHFLEYANYESLFTWYSQVSKDKLFLFDGHRGIKMQWTLRLVIKGELNAAKWFLTHIITKQELVYDEDEEVSYTRDLTVMVDIYKDIIKVIDTASRVEIIQSICLPQYISAEFAIKRFIWEALFGQQPDMFIEMITKRKIPGYNFLFYSVWFSDVIRGTIHNYAEFEESINTIDHCDIEQVTRAIKAIKPHLAFCDCYWNGLDDALAAITEIDDDELYRAFSHVTPEEYKSGGTAPNLNLWPHKYRTERINNVIKEVFPKWV